MYPTSSVDVTQVCVISQSLVRRQPGWFDDELVMFDDSVARFLADRSLLFDSDIEAASLTRLIQSVEAA